MSRRVLRPKASIKWQYLEFDGLLARQLHPWAVPEVLRGDEWVPLADTRRFDKEAMEIDEKHMEYMLGVMEAQKSAPASAMTWRTLRRPRHQLFFSFHKVLG